MKILQVNKYFYHRGGVESHFFDLAYLLRKKGVQVGFFSAKDSRNLPSEFAKYFVKHIDFEHLNPRAILNVGKIFYSFEARRKIATLIRDFKPEVAHLHLVYGSLSPSILTALKKSKVPVVLTIHDFKMICPNRMLYTKGTLCERCKNKKYFQSVKYCCVKNSFGQSLVAGTEAHFHNLLQIYQDNIKCFIAPSEFVKKTFIRFGWPKNKIVVLPHFLSSDIKKVDTPSELPQVVRFAYIGRLSQEKGVDKLVNFWLAHEIPYELEIFGDGPLYKNIYKKIAGNERITLHGQVDQKHILASMQEFTATIMPSVVHETFGLSAIESWSQGVPTIASNLGSFVELTETSKAGILFDWSDENSLKKALHNIQNMKYRRQAVEYMKKNHLPEEYLGNLFKIYKSVKK